MQRTPIYLDHHATTPVDPRVVQAMLPWFSTDFGNAASHTHVYGWRAAAAVDQAREALARAIGASDARGIVFTSGATESNNLALIGFAEANRARGDHLVTVATEHPSVLDTVRALAQRGFRVTELPVGGDGLLDPEALRRALEPRTLLVSVMWANNEIGVLQPLEAIAAVCRERGVPLHSDAAQAVGKVRVDVAAAGVDLLSFTAHKLYGPKGVGALYVRGGRPRLRLAPLLHGGGHEGGLRSGTLPVPLIVGFARAVEIAAAEREAEAERLVALRDRLRERLTAELPGVAVNGDPVRRLPGNLNLRFEGVAADALLADLPDVALSTGSACASARPEEPSHVLAALGLSDDAVRSSLRVGLGRATTRAEVDAAADRIVAAVRALRAARSPSPGAAGRVAGRAGPATA
jgi:cysteine desulfurase